MDDIGKIRQRPLTQLLKFPNILPLYGKAARIVKKEYGRSYFAQLLDRRAKGASVKIVGEKVVCAGRGKKGHEVA